VVPERKAGNQWTVVIGFQEAALEDRPTLTRQNNPSISKSYNQKVWK
jgi:hypothetical protein